MKLTERSIETAIVKRINNMPGCFCWKVPDQRRVANGVYRKDPLIPPGQPDLTACINGVIILIEVKTNTGVLSKGQKIFHSKLKSCNAPIFVCKSLADVDEAIATL